MIALAVAYGLIAGTVAHEALAQVEGRRMRVAFAFVVGALWPLAVIVGITVRFGRRSRKATP